MIRGLTGIKRATIIAMITRKPPNTNGRPGTFICKIHQHIKCKYLGKLAFSALTLLVGRRKSIRPIKIE